METQLFRRVSWRQTCRRPDFCILHSAFQVRSKKRARGLIVIPAARLWLLWVEFIKESATLFLCMPHLPPPPSREVISSARCHHLCWRTSQKRSSWWFDTAASRFNTHSVSSVQSILGQNRQPSGRLSSLHFLSGSSVCLCVDPSSSVCSLRLFLFLELHYFWLSSELLVCHGALGLYVWSVSPRWPQHYRKAVDVTCLNWASSQWQKHVCQECREKTFILKKKSSDLRTSSI